MNKPITFQNSISNEEAALLPAIEFRGPIVVVDSEPRLREACRYLAEPLYGKMDECGRSLFFTLSGTFLLSFAGDQDTADDAGQQQ